MNNSLSVKPKKKFSIGSILCIVCGLAIGTIVVLNVLGACVSLLYGITSIAPLFEYFGAMELIEPLLDIEFWLDDPYNEIMENITLYLFLTRLRSLITVLLSNVGSLIVNSLSVISFIVFGAMLMFKKHSKVLLFFPLAQLIIIALRFLGIAVNAVTLIADTVNIFLHNGSIPNIIPVLYSLISYIGPIIVLALTAIGYLLLALAIITNCKKARIGNGDAKLKFLSVLVPASLAGASALALVNTVVNSLISIAMSMFTSISMDWGMISALLSSLGLNYSLCAMAQSVYNAVAGIIENGIAAALLAVTFFFVTSWIIKPFKKEKMI